MLRLIIYLRFSIESAQRVRDALRFLQSSESNGELSLGILSGIPITMIRDSEFVDRFFLTANCEAGTLRIAALGEKLKSLIAAWEQAVADLK